MILKETIICIYNYIGINWDGAKNIKRFYLSYCFDENGVIDRELLRYVYDQIFLRKIPPSSYIGPFDEFGDMVKYTVKLCERKRKEKCVLLSAEHYNTAFEKSLELDELLKQIFDKGIVVQNPSHKKNRKFLRRIFS
ncbi:MAG: hypothetical protein OXB84_02710 [Halobacteriovoraceae bacterium]|nr:hypothetical protein [Halobacteriovoraceae bacterium]